ncbi:MAG: hypothetical protein GXY06_08605 [Clostridiaceae bacterium]|nr:hypothetical protein [Clostridiaceae bacterium]
MKPQSIFDRIVDALQPDGTLPRGFELPQSETTEIEVENGRPSANDSESDAATESKGGPNRLVTGDFEGVPGVAQDAGLPKVVRFANGAEDGIRIYHFGVTEAPDIAAEISKIIRKDVKKHGAKPNTRLIELVRTHTALSLVDHLIQDISGNSRGIILTNFAAYACRLAFESSDKEVVKLGVALLGIMETEGEEEITQSLLTLAACDEFTLYVVTALLNRSDTDELLWQIAKNVRGWGKIHAVDRLEPSTDAIRDWILRDGISNDVLDAYLALTVAEKGGLIDALRKDTIDEELFSSILAIVDALIDEGPVAGISMYENAEEALTLFVRHLESRTNTPEIQSTLTRLLKKLENPGELKLSSEATASLIEKTKARLG